MFLIEDNCVDVDLIISSNKVQRVKGVRLRIKWYGKEEFVLLNENNLYFTIKNGRILFGDRRIAIRFHVRRAQIETNSAEWRIRDLVNCSETKIIGIRLIPFINNIQPSVNNLFQPSVTTVQPLVCNPSSIQINQGIQKPIASSVPSNQSISFNQTTSINQSNRRTVVRNVCSGNQIFNANRSPGDPFCINCGEGTYANSDHTSCEKCNGTCGGFCFGTTGSNGGTCTKGPNGRYFINCKTATSCGGNCPGKCKNRVFGVNCVQQQDGTYTCKLTEVIYPILWAIGFLLILGLIIALIIYAVKKSKIDSSSVCSLTKVTNTTIQQPPVSSIQQQPLSSVSSLQQQPYTSSVSSVQQQPLSSVSQQPYTPPVLQQQPLSYTPQQSLLISEQPSQTKGIIGLLPN